MSQEGRAAREAITFFGKDDNVGASLADPTLL